MEIKKYKLLNAVEQNQMYPTTFEIPSQEEIDMLKIGDYLQVGIYVISFEKQVYLDAIEDLENENRDYMKINVERLWFEIINVYDEYFTARLRNSPLVLDMEYDTLLKVEPKYILKTHVEEL